MSGLYQSPTLPLPDLEAPVHHRTCLPDGIMAFDISGRLRYRLMLRDLSEIMAPLGIEVSHEPIWDRETRPAPIMAAGYCPCRSSVRAGNLIDARLSKPPLDRRNRVAPTT